MVSDAISFDANHDPVKNLAILSVKDGKVGFQALVKP